MANRVISTTRIFQSFSNFGKCSHSSPLFTTSKRFRSTQADPDTPKRPEVGQAKTLLDIGTRDIFSEEHDMFRETARRFFREEVAPHQLRWEKQRYCDKEIWEKMGAAGLLGVNIDADAGGIGGDFKSSAIVIEEQCYVNGAGTGFSLHSEVVMPYIMNYATPEQIQKFIPDMTAGKCVGAIAMTEPSAGSDLQGIKTYAKKDGDDWILNGSKVFITNGYLADVVITVAITDLNAERKAHGTTLFMVEADMPGFKKGKILEKVGMKSTDTTELFFEDVRLPSSAILGGEAMLNKGFYGLMSQLPRERLVVTTGCQALAEYIFEETRAYVKQRKAFGRSLSKLQTIQHRLAAMKTELCVTRSFVDRSIQLMEEGRLDSATASMGKYWVSDMLNRIVSECLQLHGGWGYMWEYPVARLFCDARVNSIYAGSNEIMREVIARDIIADK